MHLHETKLSGETLYQGAIITLEKDVVLLENGKESCREVVRHPGGVCVLALDEQDNVTLVRQFRYPYEEAILELPAGKLDRKGESPLEAAKRELQEETGLIAKDYTSLGALYPSPGYCDEIITLYAATSLTSAAQNPDEDEFLDVVRLPFAKALGLVLDGTIQDAKSQTALLKYHLLKQQNLRLV